MMNRQKIVDEYKAAYKAANGYKPKLTFRGSWLYVGNFSTAYRVSDLVEMAKDLRKRKDKILERK